MVKVALGWFALWIIVGLLIALFWPKKPTPQRGDPANLRGLKLVG